MTTNPNNAIGTNGAFGGRTSVNAFNDGLSAWTRGVMSGWACVPDSGMTVAIGGDPDTRDVAVAEDDAGNKTSINNISLAPVKMTIPGAPASNTRIDSIVAYVDNPPQGSADITDNYEACGIIVVSGTASASPVPPNETAIRTAITSDGATGATAYYVVLANVSVANGTTDITSGEIMTGDVAQLSATGVVTADNIDFTTFADCSLSEIDTGAKWIDGKRIYKKTISCGALPNTGVKNIAHGISNISRILKMDGYAYHSSNQVTIPLQFVSTTAINSVVVNTSGSNIVITTGIDRSSFTESYITLYYTKTS